MFVSEFKEPTTAPIDLSEPSVLGLAYVLRHSELWPCGFSFNFSHCTMCAMGLALRYWHYSEPTKETFAGSLSDLLGIPEEVAKKIFIWRDGRGYKPEDIAGDLEFYARDPEGWRANL